MKTQIDLKREPETRADKIIHLLVAYKNWIGGFSALFALSIMMRWIVIPLGIPRQVATTATLTGIAVPPAFMAAKYLVNKLFQPDVDVIYELDGADRHAISCYYMLKGEFTDQFEINNEPLTWINQDGRQCYCVQTIDQEEQIAFGTWLGDIPDIELMRERDRWKDQRRRNDALKQFGSQVYMKWDQITETIQYKLTNQFIRASYNMKQPEEVTKVFNGEMASLSGEQTDAKNILEEVGIDVIQTDPQDRDLEVGGSDNQGKSEQDDRSGQR